MARVPTRFVGLHSHSGSSAADGLGPPQQHIDFVLENGMDAWALTDHGHMNSFAGAYLYAQKLKEKGKNFKFIPGVEAYIHPDLDQWRRDKQDHDDRAKDAKEAKKAAKKASEGIKTNIERVGDNADETTDVEISNALTIENEEETKSNKTFNPVNRRHHMVVLPKTPHALKKIFHAVSRGYLEGFYRFPRLDLKVLKEAVNGENDIVITSACLGGFLSYEILSQMRFVEFDKMDARLLDDPALMNSIMTALGNTYDKYVDAVGPGNVMLELQFNRLPAQDVVNRALIEFARRNSLTQQLTVASDSHYARPELWYFREMYKKLGYMNYTDIGPESLPKSKEDIKADLYPKNASQVWEEYLQAKDRQPFYDSCDDIVCDAVERTHDLAHQVIGDITYDTTYKFPQKVIPKGKTSMQALVQLAKEGLERRGLADKQEYVDRLRHELEIIRDMNFSDYFVTLSRMMELARTQCLVGVARGSGGGSLVAYCLNITDLDPIKYECRFDRFLNKFRQGAPDIDIDVGNRDAVLDVLRKEFGYNNVVPISNVNLFKLKSLVKDISKFYGIPFEEVNEATRTVDQEVRKAIQNVGDDKNLFTLKFDDAMKHSPSFAAFINKYPHVTETISVLLNEQRSLGRHAGGVLVLDDGPKEMPIITSGGEPQTPWVEGMAEKLLEPLGFIKYDLLGLETMRLIARTIELILQRREGVQSPEFDQVLDWYNKNLHPDVNNYDDQKVYEYVYHEGRFSGVFQLTSQGAQKLFKAAKPRSVVDIAVLTSIYRPGPLAANVDKIYLKARSGEKYDWGHPIFEKVLGLTDNCLIFQEQVMDLVEHVGSFPKEECDKVRKAIMKRTAAGSEEQKKKAAAMEEQFVQGAVKNGVPKEIAHEAYRKILFFSGYGFNKSHAVAYAIDSYMCAWLHTYYEEEWLCAYLESMSGNPEDKARAFGEVRSLGYQIVPIDINHATTTWTIIPGKKFMPSFLSCKGVGVSAYEEILANRPYRTIEDLLWNEDGSWKHSKFNKRALEGLIKIEAFGSMDLVGEGKLFSSYKQMHQILVEGADKIKKTTKKDPFTGRKNFYELLKDTAEMEEWDRSEKVVNMVEHLGSIDISSVVSFELIKKLEEKQVRSIDEIDGPGIYWFAAQASVPKKTKAGKTYLVFEAVGPSGKPVKVSCWGWDGAREFAPYSVILAELEKNDFGVSTKMWKLKELSV